MGYDEWALSNALWMKSCSSHDKYKPELNECFHIYKYQLNLAMFFVTSALDISWQHFSDSILLVRSA